MKGTLLGGGICKEGIALDSDAAAQCDGPDGAGAKEIWKQFTLKEFSASFTLEELCVQS